MATQSLYRRYRPRRFSEVRGQDHVVRALRNAVRNHREGQAYLFSGPRGTGKTTSARILAKVLNCEHPDDGEPCCQCDSCLAVEAGTSYDVFELDAASNNGVEHIRDLIDRASLGTPGRHKVYILDEVHMLSKAASAALLKTLEEPPPHVVFVLATTDPQKVLETIRSRTQHLQFHLLPIDELEAYVRWVAADAGISLTDELVQAVLRQGAGSARDTLSALELAATSEGLLDEATPVDEFVEALIEADTARVLAAVAHAVQHGRDPRTLTEDLIGHLRNCFLALMAPELVQLTDVRAEQVAEQARRLGAGQLVKAMETLGDVLLEVRHAPDPRVLVEVALVKLTHRELETGLEALLHRVEQLERAVAQAAAAPAAPPVERDPTTGRARLGARAGRDATGPLARPSAPEPTPAAPAPAASSPPGGADSAGVAARWSTDVLPALKPIVRALYAAGRVVGPRDDGVVVAFPNEPHCARAEQHRPAVEQVMAVVGGGPVRLVLTVERDPSPGAAPSPAGADDDIDLSELVDAPPGPVTSPIDRLTQAFPGSELVSDEG
jgi:DNA polymerase-3 subunit gamma/tau